MSSFRRPSGFSLGGGLSVGGGLSAGRGLSLPSGGGPPPYVAPAVHFNGATFLRNAALASIDSPVFSFSYWVKIPAGAPDALNAIFVVGAESSASAVNISGGVPAGTTIVSDGMTGLELDVPNPFSAGWVNIIGSFNLSVDNAYKAKIYANDVDVTGTFSSDVSIDILSNGLPFNVGGEASANWLTGDMADLWVAPNVSLLDGGGDIPVATRRLFISASGKPVNPSGFPASAILFSGDATTFATNQGSGGSFTTTGTLTNASSSPSD